MPDSAAALGAILLAAGESRRLRKSKQLLEFEGEPLVVRQAKLLAGLNAARVVVVCGAEADAIAPLLADFPVDTVHNPDWRSGMGSSLACGVRAMPERARAALVVLCDQWKLTEDDLRVLVGAWAPNPLAAVVAGYNGMSGPPAILPRAMFDRLARLEGDSGAQQILRKWKGEVVTVPLDGAAADIDEPSDVPP
jgi:CTP:molybdopterin cytidylyltransferase MocA